MRLTDIQYRKLQLFGRMEKGLKEFREFHSVVAAISEQLEGKGKATDDLKAVVTKYAELLRQLDYDLAP